MSDQPTPARSFGSVVDAYDRGRPGYPREAAAWLVGDEPLTILEVGAGTGKLTETLVALGHDVHATDPDPTMLARLRARLPDVPTSVAPAEELPAPDAAYDVVVAGQAFHWFDQERALTEFARVLKPGGRIALVWNERDTRIPWVRRFGDIVGAQEQDMDPRETLAACGWFGPAEDAQFRHWQVIDRESVQDLVLSRSNIAVLDDEGRREKLAEVLDFYDDFGRGMDGMQLPYVARCFRAVVVDRPEPKPVEAGETTDEAAERDGADAPPTDPAGPVETAEKAKDEAESDDVLLIDFR